MSENENISGAPQHGDAAGGFGPSGLEPSPAPPAENLRLEAVVSLIDATGRVLDTAQVSDSVLAMAAQQMSALDAFAFLAGRAPVKPGLELAALLDVAAAPPVVEPEVAPAALDGVAPPAAEVPGGLAAGQEVRVWVPGSPLHGCMVRIGAPASAETYCCEILEGPDAGSTTTVTKEQVR